MLKRKELLSTFVTVYKPTGTLRSVNVNPLGVSHNYNTNNLSDGSFEMFAPTLWNTLSAKFCSIPPLSESVNTLVFHLLIHFNVLLKLNYL